MGMKIKIGTTANLLILVAVFAVNNLIYLKLTSAQPSDESISKYDTTMRIVSCGGTLFLK